MRVQKVPELLDAGKSTEVENLRAHVDPTEHLVQLKRAALGRPLTLKLRQMSPDLLKGDAVAAIVSAVGAKSDGTARKGLAYDRGDLADAIVLSIIPDIEYFVVDLIAGCFER